MLDEEASKDDPDWEKADFELWPFRYRYRSPPRLVVHPNWVKEYVARSREMTLCPVFLALDRLWKTLHLSHRTPH